MQFCGFLSSVNCISSISTTTWCASPLNAVLRDRRILGACRHEVPPHCDAEGEEERGGGKGEKEEGEEEEERNQVAALLEKARLTLERDKREKWKRKKRLPRTAALSRRSTAASADWTMHGEMTPVQIQTVQPPSVFLWLPRAVYLEFWTLFYDPLVWQILFGAFVSRQVCWSLDSSGRRLPDLFLFGAFVDSTVDTCTYVSSGGPRIIPAIPCVKVDFGSEVDSEQSTTALFWQLVVRCLSCLKNTGLLQLGRDDFKKMLRVRRCWLDSGYTVIRQFTELFVKVDFAA